MQQAPHPAQNPGPAMSKPRTLRLSCQRSTSAVCVAGTDSILDVYGCVPPGAVAFEVKKTAGVEVSFKHETVQTDASRSLWPLSSGVEVLVSMALPSDDLNDKKVKVTYYGKNKDNPLASARVYFTSVVVSLNVDSSRSGAVNKRKSHQESWTWGPGGHGAILLVNCDWEESYNKPDAKFMCSCADLADMSRMILRTHGPKALFDTHKVVLHITPDEADKVCVFHAKATDSGFRLKHALGRERHFYQVSRTSVTENIFYVEGLEFPDAGFPGLVSVGVTLLDGTLEAVPDIPLFTEDVIFRITPWIMTPNTLKPLEVFVCSMLDNNTFLEQLTDLVKRAKCRLTICPKVENRGDRWMQDEMEFGYIEAPHKGFPVVLDSPRNRELDAFPFKKLLGPDFGYVTREPKDASEVNSLDSFGNLEVSPPVTVNGKEYPLGRIVFGSNLPTFSGRRMNKVVRDFLYAQQVQAPVELYSDWLIVGHVDEFMSFVPSPSKKGFCLLLASPVACCQLFEEKQKEGHGDKVMFQGLETQQVTIKELLADEKLMKDNKYVQGCIDWNRDILKQELGLGEEDIIDLPVLFFIPEKNTQAVAFFPDMVNMIVLGKHLGIPKPFGPVIDGKCCLETKVRSLLEPLGLNCTFIDDFTSYHQNLGEVHCGTNVRREPFAFKWWNIRP